MNVTKDSGLGFGPVTANNSTVNFTSNSPSLYNSSFGNSTTVNFSGTLPNLDAPLRLDQFDREFHQAGADS